MSRNTRRPWGFGRLARGSSGLRSVDPNHDWISVAVRARFPKLAAALGDNGFDMMLGAYLAREPLPEPPTSRPMHETSARIAEFLSASTDYPAWYAELAQLDRAHVDVLHAGPSRTLRREDLLPEQPLRLVDAHALVELTTAVDELWVALDQGNPPERPRELDYPRTVLVWRAEGLTVKNRTALPDEALGLRAAARGTTLDELASIFAGENPSARALDIALTWIDQGVIAR